MRRRGSLLLTAAAIAATAVASGWPFFPPDVITEYDHSASLANRTYSWGELALKVPSYQGVVRAAIDKNLQARGWHLVPSGGSSTVFAVGDVLNESGLDAFYESMTPSWKPAWGLHGLGPGWKPGSGEFTLSALDTAAGHLVVDLFDTGSHQLLFRGVMREDLSNTEKSNTKKLNASLKYMLKQLPRK